MSSSIRLRSVKLPCYFYHLRPLFVWTKRGTQLDIVQLRYHVRNVAYKMYNRPQASYCY